MRFEDDFLKKLEYLRIVSMRAFAGRDRADRLARKRGRGLEFADYRQYAPGDDVRHIDWKAYKRLNRLLLRLFDEEQDLPVYLFLDVSRSMGDSAKFDQAKRIAAALCYIGLVHFDQVAILPFDSTLGQETVPGRGRGRIFTVFARLEQLVANGRTDLLQSFKRFASRSHRRGMAIVISDFLDPAGFQAGLRLLSGSGHDVLAVHMMSGDEQELRELGGVRFVDAESGEFRDIDVTSGLARAYGDAWRTHAEEVEAFCGRAHLAYVRANAEDPFEDVILRTFREGGFLA
jgi:uncharacterized protein (DUF58 family)